MSRLGMQLFRALRAMSPKRQVEAPTRRPTPTAGFLHVSGRLRDSGQLYQGLFAEGIYQPRAWERTRTVSTSSTLYVSAYTSDNIPAVTSRRLRQPTPTTGFLHVLREAIYCVYVSLVIIDVRSSSLHTTTLSRRTFGGREPEWRMHHF